MKKEQRSVYVVLTGLVDCTLCTFCSYGRTIGFCCENGLECTHPLVDKFDMFNSYCGMEPDMDCWGFKRQLPHEDLIDSVGIILQHGLGFMGMD